MRVSPIAEIYENQKEIICLSAMSADATHNHYEGIKGAVIAAMMIWMAYRGYDKEQIFQYMLGHYRDDQNVLPSVQRFKKFDMQELRQNLGIHSALLPYRPRRFVFMNRHHMKMR